MCFLSPSASLPLLTLAITCVASSAWAQPAGDHNQGQTAGIDHDLAESIAIGLKNSRFIADVITDLPSPESSADTPLLQANLADFETHIRPLLEQNCFDCHASEESEGNIRLDTLDPDLLHGPDTDWWSEVFAVITKSEMPPPDYGELGADQRQQLVDWLSSELHAASITRRKSGAHSAFRRMTRYEYNYALQDLLGLPFDFAIDLPPEAQSEEGFENGADLLHLSVSQFETYYRIAHRAIERATAASVQPPTRYWGVAMEAAAEREWKQQDKQIADLEQELANDPEKLTAELEKLRKRFREPPRGAYYKNLIDGRTAEAEWNYHGARYAFSPQDQPVALPEDYECVAILPSGSRSKLIVELGNQLPDEGLMRVTVRASRVNTSGDSFPSLQLLFGWQASNEGRALLRVSELDTPITAGPDQPQIVQWDVPLGEIYPRNSVRKTSPMGALPSPSEYIRLVNSSASDSEIQIDFVQVAAPVFDQWPPESHQRLFGRDNHTLDEKDYARKTISAFMRRAWRRPITEAEINHKLDLFAAVRADSSTVEEAITEVLATVLSSPQFLYVASGDTIDTAIEDPQSGAYALANRLSLFLWCSIPDQELMTLADDGRLCEAGVLDAQIERMLDDPRSQRFAEHFVHQWLNLELLEFLNLKPHIGDSDPLLKESMQYEPVALFAHVLREDASILDFIHSDYAIVDERLARHYGLTGVYGNTFRRVSLEKELRRGGLLTQAGLLAMNSDYPDSHPLKRAIWLLECILSDPPPPPPPAVPQIDLADPEIAKMTLKERIEDHRNHAACLSCHIKIDPWGIAFENYDALGRWRDEINGKPIDAASELFNRQTLDGMDGLKRFLLQNRQDQIVQSMVTKLATYALGRPMGFADQAEVDAIAARVRRNGDGLKTAVKTIVQSDLFRSN